MRKSQYINNIKSLMDINLMSNINYNKCIYDNSNLIEKIKTLEKK